MSKRRFELVESGASKFWEVTSAGSSFDVAWGKIGTSGQSQTKSFDNDALAAQALAKLVKEKVGKGYVEVSAGHAPAESATGEAPLAAALREEPGPTVEPATRQDPARVATREEPPQTTKGAKTKTAKEPVLDALAFEGWPGKKVQGLVDKLAALTEAYRAASLMKKAGLESPRDSHFAWHVAALGLLSPVHDPLLSLLVPPYAAIEATADRVFAVLRAIPEQPEVPHTRLFSGWSVLEARIAAHAVSLDPARAEALLPELSPRVRLGVQLARGLAGVRLTEEDRRAITERMAQVDVRGQLAASSNGQRSLHGNPWDASTQIAVPLGVLAAIGVDEASYVRAQAAAILLYGVGSFDAARPALRGMELPALVEGLCRHTEGEQPILAYQTVLPKIAELLAERGDAPDALRAAAATLDASRHQQALAALLLAQAGG